MLRKTLGLVVACAAISQGQTLKEVIASQYGSIGNWGSAEQGISYIRDIFLQRDITCFVANTTAWNQFAADPQFGTYFEESNRIATYILYSCVLGLHKSSTFSSDPTFLRTLLTRFTVYQPGLSDYRNATAATIQSGGMPLEVVKFDNGTISVISAPNAYEGPADAHPGLGKLQAWITEADIPFANGIVHVLDNFLSTGVDQTLSSVGSIYQNKAIIDRTAAGTLNGAENDTTFISYSDAAYEKFKTLPASQQTLLDSYLRISGQVIFTNSFTEAGNTTMSSGYPITFQIRNGEYYINDCRVYVPNAFLVNGVLHLAECYPIPPGSGISPAV